MADSNFSETQKIIIGIQGDVKELRSHSQAQREQLGDLRAVIESLVRTEMELKHLVTDNHKTFERIFTNLETHKMKREEVEKDLDELKAKHEAVINRIRGAYWVASFIFSAIAASAIWMFNIVMTMHDKVTVHDHVIRTQIEKRKD